MTAAALSAGLGTLQKSIFKATVSLGGYTIAGYQTLAGESAMVLSIPLRIGLSVLGGIIADMIFPGKAY